MESLDSQRTKAELKHSFVFVFAEVSCAGCSLGNRQALIPGVFVPVIYISSSPGEFIGYLPWYFISIIRLLLQ